ncbi:MAG: hypothetical protein FGM37_00750 [Phycisphaerales bacterium]|nr:hypothetical protein [Phycisphaerales bacterium]
MRVISTGQIPERGSTIRGWLREYGTIVAAVAALQFVTYMYLFTLPIFTNHTFPSATLHPYPHYRAVGRWLADAVVWIQGGSGVAPLLMTGSALLQAVNGILLATLVGVTRRRDTLLVAAALSLYPAFMDYYSFPVDQLYFVLADTAVLAGMLVWRHSPTSWRSVTACAALFLAAIACYQPKVSLIVLLALACVLLIPYGTLSAAAATPHRAQQHLRKHAVLVVAICAAGSLYFLSTRLLGEPAAGSRTYTNTIQQAISAAALAYPTCAARLLVPVDYLPGPLAWIPPALLIAGVLAALTRARRHGWPMLAMAIAAIALMPLALQAAQIINKNTWAVAGRILAADGYVTTFFTACVLCAIPGAAPVLWAIGLMCAGLVVTGSQQSNAAAFKTVYDVNLMNRVLSRAEPLLNPAGQEPRALVMVGAEPRFMWSDFVRDEPRGIHLYSNTLAPYRQVLTLNFFAGWSAFRAPNRAEVEDALRSAANRPHWPSDGSVYLHHDTVVVVMEPYQPTSPVTWTRD